MATLRPIIGITTYSPDEQGRYYLSALYVAAVRRAGGIAVLLPPGDADPTEVLRHVDGLVFAGGGDIHPESYGGVVHPTNYMMDATRDQAERTLIKAALDRQTPTLCVCRGLQMLNVTLGGTLHAHLPEVVGETVLHRGPPRVPVPHPIHVESGTLLADLLGTTHCSPISWHHQAVNSLGRGLRPIARADDGVVEALAHDTHPWLVAVQWHPELSADNDPSQQALFDGLVRRAASRHS